jgi:hypothetical protein
MKGLAEHTPRSSSLPEDSPGAGASRDDVTVIQAAAR